MFASISCNLLSGLRCLLVAGALFLMVPGATAGLLLTDPDTINHGAAPNLGEFLDLGDDYIIGFKADLEYAVYYGSAPSLGLTDPLYANKYIYAYQFLNHAESYDPINQFSVGVLGDMQISNEGYMSGSGIAPSHWDWTLSSSNSIVGEFKTPEVAPGQHSAIFYFASPFGPGQHSASFVGGIGTTTDVFSPVVPEPAAILMLIGAMAFFLAPLARQRYNKP
jgi:hypothetical protein